MRYFDKMLIVAHMLTQKEQIVLMPFVLKGGQKGDPDEAMGVMLDDMHKRKIDMSESITVVGMHIGDSTKSEIDYAQKTGKTVYYWTDHFGQME
jgi:DNA-binding transcriptional regulator/RsmH inhibitor MraZ